MRDLSKEQLRGIYLNAHYKVIHDEVVSMGTIDTNIVHPREVFKPAVEYAASGLILVHNHPSGSTDPSEADLETTKQLVAAGELLGITLIDHIIVTRAEFKSIPVAY
jgi:DNA repair protein RadC